MIVCLIFAAGFGLAAKYNSSDVFVAAAFLAILLAYFLPTVQDRQKKIMDDIEEIKEDISALKEAQDERYYYPKKTASYSHCPQCGQVNGSNPQCTNCGQNL